MGFRPGTVARGHHRAIVNLAEDAVGGRVLRLSLEHFFQRRARIIVLAELELYLCQEHARGRIGWARPHRRVRLLERVGCISQLIELCGEVDVARYVIWASHSRGAHERIGAVARGSKALQCAAKRDICKHARWRSTDGFLGNIAGLLEEAELEETARKHVVDDRRRLWASIDRL